MDSPDGQKALETAKVGTTNKIISLDLFRNMAIPLLPLSDQKKIAAEYGRKNERIRELKIELEEVRREKTGLIL